jgi:hypothetical protein
LREAWAARVIDGLWDMGDLLCKGKGRARAAFFFLSSYYQDIKLGV